MPSKDSIRRIGDYFLELVAENNIFFHQSFRSVEEITAPVLKKVLNFFGRSFQDFFGVNSSGYLGGGIPQSWRIPLICVTLSTYLFVRPDRQVG
jgi:hypothetical protein